MEMLQALRVLGPSGVEEKIILGSCEIVNSSHSSVYMEPRLMGGREGTKVDRVRGSVTVHSGKHRLGGVVRGSLWSRAAGMNGAGGGGKFGSSMTSCHMEARRPSSSLLCHAALALSLPISSFGGLPQQLPWSTFSDSQFA